MITMRNRFKAFGRGRIEFLKPDNSKVFAFIREYRDEIILVVVNLSRFSQVVELDLSHFEGYVPEEIFGRNTFPIIKKSPYVLTLSHFGYYCFLLQKEKGVIAGKEKTVRELTVSGTWEKILTGKAREGLEEQILPDYVKNCRWFGGKARIIQQLKIIEDIALRKNNANTHLLILELTYTEGLPELYLLPLAFVSGNEAKDLIEHFPHAVVGSITTTSSEGILYDGSCSAELREDLFSLIARNQLIKGMKGTLVGTPGKKFTKAIKENLQAPSKVLHAEQSNTSFVYDEKFFFKLYRRLDEGINPDVEIGRFLTEKTSFSHSAHFAGAIEYRKPGAEPIVIGILQTLVPNQGDAWTFTLDALGRFYERVLVQRNDLQNPPEIPSSLLALASQELPPLLHELIGGVYLERARLLGRRTGELHLVLASDRGNPDFLPESFSLLYQRSLYQSMASLTKKTFELLRKSSRHIQNSAQEDFQGVLVCQEKIMNRFKILFSQKIAAMKTRIHGHYHLGQVLFTGNDFVIIDFEGEPAKALSERRLKRSPLSDVAGMVRSFHYAAYVSLFQHLGHMPEDFQELEICADLWYKCVAGAFFGAYLETVKGSPIIPEDEDHLEILLNTFLLEKAIYELSYEINNRPEWIIIPLKGIKHLLDA